jgi:hypothetical protein
VPTLFCTALRTRVTTRVGPHSCLRPISVFTWDSALSGRVFGPALNYRMFYGGAPLTVSLSEIPLAAQIDFSALMRAGGGRVGEELIGWLAEELVYASHDAYLAMTPRLTDIARISQGPFEYVYDDYASLEAQGLVPAHPTMEARLVLAIGRSAPRLPKRDDSRLRGWAGPSLTNVYGPGWDRGHFIAHSMGGVVDGFELNVFVQRRSLNRGWKSHPRGGLYRQMEKYCASNDRTLCFSRPIYCDETAKPTFIEFGILKPDGTLWLELFDNR